MPRTISEHFYSSIATLSSLASAATLGAGTLSVPSATYVGYPASYPYTIRVEGGTTNEELCDVTGTPTVSGANLLLPVTRGVDGSSPAAHAAGSIIDHPVTARDLQEMADHMYSTQEHGLTSGRFFGFMGAVQRYGDLGLRTVTTDASGYAVVTHNLGILPLVVLATPYAPAGGSPIFGQVIVNTYTTTNFTIRAISSVGASIASTSVSFVYWAVG